MIPGIFIVLIFPLEISLKMGTSGNSDIILSNYSGIDLYLNSGDATFNTRVIGQMTYGINDVCLGDLDGDDDIDPIGPTSQYPWGTTCFGYCRHRSRILRRRGRIKRGSLSDIECLSATKHQC